MGSLDKEQKVDKFKHDPKDVWGQDLIKVFGPKHKRTHISELTYAQKQEILDNVDEYIETDHLGPFPTMYQVVNTVLDNLARSQALMGIDLDWQEEDALKKSSLVISDDMYFHTETQVKNNLVQRGIFLRRMVKVILFNYDPIKHLCGLARKIPGEDCFVNNDSQHRTTASIIMGIRWVPLQYQESELKSVDIAQYSCVNLYSLPSSTFDTFRIMRETGKSAVNEDGIDLDTAEQQGAEWVSWYKIHQILEVQNQIKIVEKVKGRTKGECGNVGNLHRDLLKYGEEILERAVSIVTQTMHDTVFAAQNVEAICAFIASQKDLDIDPIDMDYYIADGIRWFSPKGKHSGVHSEAARAVNSGTENMDLKINLNTAYASGILFLVRGVSDDIDWIPITVKGESTVYDIAKDFIEPNWKIIPRQ